jgi:aldehyde:ferredoxin oxidoreductase
MRISALQINQLKTILLEITGKEYSSEELQTEGLKILRFVYALEIRKHLNDSVKRDPLVNPNEVMPPTGQTSQERNI